MLCRMRIGGASESWDLAWDDLVESELSGRVQGRTRRANIYSGVYWRDEQE